MRDVEVIMKNNIGEAIRLALSALGMSQNKLCELSGVSAPSLSRIVRYGARPEPKSMVGIKAALPEEWSLRVIEAHLRDELQRAGEFQRDWQIRCDTGPVTRDALSMERAKCEEMAALLVDAAVQLPRVRQLLEALSELSKGWVVDAPAFLLQTAETRAAYRAMVKRSKEDKP